MYCIIYYLLIHLFLFTEILIISRLGYYKLGLTCLGTQWVNITEREINLITNFLLLVSGKITFPAGPSVAATKARVIQANVA